MAKVNIKSEKITPFGGIYYASKAFYALSLDKVVNGALGVRSSTYNGYQWDEIISAMSDVFLCGGDCVEDANRSECHLRESPEVRIPTSHIIGRAINPKRSLGRKMYYFMTACGLLSFIRRLLLVSGS
nr:hypothetical protein [uncultured Prevotella sp.]